MAKYMLMFIGSDERWESMPAAEREKAYQAIGVWWNDLSSKGIIKGGEELQGAHTATTVRKRDGKVLVTDGPFMEAKERIGGFGIVEVANLDEAIALAKTWPGSAVEVRPVVEEH